MNLHRWIGLILLTGSLQGRAQDFSPVFTEEQRLTGFAEHNKSNREFNRERESGAGSVKKQKLQWEAELQKSVPEYKEWKRLQAQSLDERSPEYKAEKQHQRQEIKEHEEFRSEYVRERNRQQAKQKSHVQLTEEHEYGLDQVVVRADVKNRALYGGKVSWLKNVKLGEPSSPPGKGSSSEPAPSTVDFGAPPPPPTTGGPDFYEPEIPPPPPPEPGSFDESIPPPIFDEPEF